VFKKTPVGEVIEAYRHTKQLLNDVIFIHFSDKNAIPFSYTEKFTQSPNVSIFCNKK